MSVMMSVCFLRVSALSLVLGLRPPSIGPGCAVVPLSHRNCLRDRDAIERCFAGKVVHVYGNSVSRHWAYTLAYVLQGKARFKLDRDGNFRRGDIANALRHLPDRRTEKEECAHDGGRKSCEWRLGRGTRLVMRWQQAVHDERFERELTNSCRPDVAIVSVGSDDVYRAGSELPARGGHSSAERETYWHARLSRLGPELVRTLRVAASLGTRVYYRTSTPNCVSRARHDADGTIDYVPGFSHERDRKKRYREGLRNLNSALHQGGQEMLAMLCEARNASALPPVVRVMDAFDWIADGAPDPARAPGCASYDDGVHHPQLQFAHVNALLCDFCET